MAIILVFSLAFSFSVSKGQVTDSASIYIQNYQYGQALDFINRLDVKTQPQSLTLMKARALMGLNRFGEAIPYFTLQLKEDTANLPVIISLADCYRSIADYANARLYYQKALKLDPGNGYLFQQLADAFYLDEDFSPAVAWYNKAYLSDSSYYLSKQLARAYEKLDIQDTAILFYRRAVDLNPGDFHSSYRLADLLRQADDLESAIGVAESYLQIDSVRIRMIKYNAYLHYLQKDYLKALDGFRKCLVLGDQSAFTHKYLGYCFFRVGEYDVAMTYLEQAFHTDTANANLCYALGLSCDYSGHEKKGIKYLQKTLDLIVPSDDFLSQVYQDLAAVYNDNGDFQEALDVSLEALKLTPDEPVLLYKIGRLYDRRKHDLKRARDFYQRFLTTREKVNQAGTGDSIGSRLVMSYYDFAERRLKEINEDLFWMGQENDTTASAN